jgi:hypothetical protein
MKQTANTNRILRQPGVRSPREILLSRHISANSRLDAIRVQVVAAECRQSPRPTLTVNHTCVAPWHARFWPSPWAWAGLAAVWMLTIILHILAFSGVKQLEMARSSRFPPAAIEMALAEQRVLMSELARNPSRHETSPPHDPVLPRPRSERKSYWSVG